MSELIEHFRKLAEYEAHYNAALLCYIRQHEVAEGRPLELLSHISNVQDVWLNRIFNNADGQAANTWQIISPEILADIQKLNNERMASAIEMLSQPGAQTINYTNSTGAQFSNQLSDILYHLFNHGTYHRAQMADTFKKIGLQPIPTDYIIYIRNKEQANTTV